MVDRAESVMHARFGDLSYWEARRSMRFAKRLVDVADKFRKEELGSNDADDKTVRTAKWEDHTVIKPRKSPRAS